MTMTIVSFETERFGTLEVSPDEVINVVDPMPGFAGLDAVLLIPVDDHGIFVWVQSASPPDTAFLAANPFVFHPDYEIEIGDETGELLETEPGDDIAVYTLVTIRGGEAATNLAAPFIVNTRSRRAVQIILDADWPLRARLERGDSPVPSKTEVRP
jgi:flagellar assembly factor FliW